MLIKIIYEGETLFVEEAQIEGYAGCEVIGPAGDDELADCPYRMVSAEHIRSVHLQKAIEATLILSGYDLSAGLLAEEAAALGLDLTDLAATVRGKRRAECDFEVARRSAKVAGDWGDE